MNDTVSNGVSSCHRPLRDIIWLAVISVFLVACQQPAHYLITGSTMGTSYSVKIVAPDIDQPALEKAIDDELVRINKLMSTYDENSELSRFNRSEVGVKTSISADTATVLNMSHKIYEESDHAFDITVGPLVNLWGFGPQRHSVIPSQQQIETAKKKVGFQNLVFTDNSATRKANITLDLSAIAKGYAVDQIAALLDQHGINNYLVEVGGELSARGINERGRPWTIAVEKPDSLSRSVYRTLVLKNLAMATSGDYRNYFEVDGVRYSHTIDPRTGRPITHQVASVTVLHPSAALADGYATAIDVLGAERGLALAEQQNLAVLVIIKTVDGFEERSSPALKAYLLSRQD